MSRIYSVAITTAAPINANDPGSVAIGYYVLEHVDGKKLLRMTNEAGETIEIGGQQWIRELEPSQNARKLAASLTQSIRLAASERDGFHRKLTHSSYRDLAPC